MSVFEKYDETSRHYDKTRVAIGGEILLGCLARHAKPLHELKVLDAGSPTVGTDPSPQLVNVNQLETS